MVSDAIVCLICSLFAIYTVDGSLALFWNHLAIASAVVFVQILFFGLFKMYSIRLLDSSLELFVRGSSGYWCPGCWCSSLFW